MLGLNSTLFTLHFYLGSKSRDTWELTSVHASLWLVGPLNVTGHLKKWQSIPSNKGQQYFNIPVLCYPAA
jgi:hypothetical protein